MQDYLFRLFEKLEAELFQEQRLQMNYRGENSDFVRFNNNKIRQAGNVNQHEVTLELIEGARHQSASLMLSADFKPDLLLLRSTLQGLQQTIAELPEDPFLNLPQTATQSEFNGDNELPGSAELLAEFRQLAGGQDVVGILANGGIYSAMMDSSGSRHWHSVYSHHLDWSLYWQNGRAVKNSLAGNAFNKDVLRQKCRHDRERLEIMCRDEVNPGPGKYRVYLCPAALNELIGMLCWGDFGVRMQQNRQSALMPLIEQNVQWSDKLQLVEQRGGGLLPDFTSSGFLCDQSVNLVDSGLFGAPLVAARSAREYGLDVNTGVESPQALSMTAGDLPVKDALAALDTGLYLTNLWYCNYSDRAFAKVTGMTRYACLWVEQGRIAGPLASMRFDVSLHDLFSSGLLDLTRERELISDDSSYQHRSMNSTQLPGMLAEGFSLTL